MNQSLIAGVILAVVTCRASSQEISDLEGFVVNEPTVITQYSGVYMRLLREEMGDLSAYRGSECSLNMHLSDKGLVERVEMQSQSKLCRVAFNAIWEIAFFPLPADKQDADKLRDMKLLVSPQ
ncbi:cell envelope integrity TolA C-terminal domain-containing protein [Photobacterium leiognathi]|uniref:cell envelope integrity TolA C-terminal domain-containing protein n=1 Tax=Photobacterium leiognathi TaxID=553611 RepID=UPI0029829ADC|nr:cell envelope integrity TolA C-terminal domain-containing protein [Photobacterium leiognathi]